MFTSGTGRYDLGDTAYVSDTLSMDCKRAYCIDMIVICKQTPVLLCQTYLSILKYPNEAVVTRTTVLRLPIRGLHYHSYSIGPTNSFSVFVIVISTHNASAIQLNTSQVSVVE